MLLYHIYIVTFIVFLNLEFRELNKWELNLHIPYIGKNIVNVKIELQS